MRTFLLNMIIILKRNIHQIDMKENQIIKISKYNKQVVISLYR